MPKDTQAQALAVSIGQYSNAGRKPSNQDFHGALVPSGATAALKGITLAIADGISSSAVSAEASETAVKSLLTDYYSTPDSWTVKVSALRVIEAANSWLHGLNTSVADINAGRVCTFSALILKGREAHVFHVGDSRVSRVTKAGIEPLTEDHRMVMSPGQSYLARAMGAEPAVSIDYSCHRLAVGDVYLLTTDGVHEFTDSRVVLASLAEERDLDAVAMRIAREAYARGSDDNLTVQIVRIDALGDAGTAFEGVALPRPALPNTGDHLDNFRIVRPIQTTARSHVFLAVDEQGKKVALKIPASETGEDETYLRRFALEEWVARRVASPHVLQAAEGPRTSLYVAMEWVEGTTLRQWMIDNPHPPLDRVRDIVGQIVEGLRALHRRQMIHQDLRPENVMIDADGTVKLIDLGSVTVKGVEEAAPGTLPEMPGTYQYTAPEYLSGDVVSWRSDQYSLGVIAYELLTSRLPYGAQVARIRSRADQLKLVYAPARDDRNGVPDWIDAALKRAVHPDPLRRFDALSEFLADLRRPGAAARGTRHVPLAERNPVLFWQVISGVLAVICLILIANLN